MKLVMHSGGAVGADKLWEDVFTKAVYTDAEREVNHYYYKQKTPHGNKEITEKDFKEGLYFAKLASKRLNKTWSNKSFVHYLLARNWVQVREAQIILAIGYLNEETQQVYGGTGYAIEMAKMMKKPIYLINLNELKNKTINDKKDLLYRILSYSYYYDKFTIDSTVINEINICSNGIFNVHFAGIGTRDLNGIDMELLISVMQDVLYFLLPDNIRGLDIKETIYRNKKNEERIFRVIKRFSSFS